MTTPAAAALLNLLGYITGAALYAMLLVMAMGRPRAALSDSSECKSNWPDRLPLLTALLGLAWNLGALSAVALQSVTLWRGLAPLSWLPLVNAAAFTALGFLPAVVVHSLLRQREGWAARTTALAMTLIAYALSAAAGALHFHEAIVQHFAPSHWALHTLTIGFLCLIVALLIYTRLRATAVNEMRWKGMGWALALAVFAVSALHLSHHEGREFSWWVELIGHHASLPLALAILYQDYRFALADIFLKRALSLVLLVGLAFGLYLGAAAPLLARTRAMGDLDALAVGFLIGLWVVTALAYPLLRRAVNRFIDVVVLRRADYDAVRAGIAQSLAAHEAPERILSDVCLRLSEALTAREVRWAMVESIPGDEINNSPSGPLLPQLRLVERRRNTKRLKDDAMRSPSSGDAGESRLSITAATVFVPTAETPQFRLSIGELRGGRRLLSNDLELIETAAVMAARRIDAVRVAHERCVRDLHEQEVHKLATEAELRALRAQINPHFLFNALTTIGYLIQAAPDRALQTLMRLTTLLRAVLRQSDGEFSTLGEEIELIESYLEIERARFEDRLRVMIDAPEALRGIRIPALLIQPLVENAIKHGISPQRAGGEVVILARSSREETRGSRPSFGDDRLQIWVRDTGAGASESALAHGRKHGVGLANVEQRIRRHFGDAGTFGIRSAPGVGTTVELTLPIKLGGSAGTAANATQTSAKTGNSLAVRR